MDEFKKLVDGFGVSYNEGATPKEAFEVVKNRLSDEDLDDFAGGYCIDSWRKKSSVATGLGKKVD